MAGARPCLVCDSDQGKYKCPLCGLYTCSLTCFRDHRDNHPHVEPPPMEQPKSTFPSSSGDVKPAGGFQDTSGLQESTAQSGTLERSEIADLPEYKALTQRFPQLERLLWAIAVATDPPTPNGGSNGMHNPLPGFNKGRRKANQPWTRDVGYENGIDVLRRIRDAPGDDREALREYSELVRLYTARRETANAEANIRQELARDNAKAIGELMRTEKSST
ncbi:hypothetical protein M426DRAFT_23737 [Hypoxylon sp. CI-4A]|nr:hypothetical protein M426DRAFT_23737 [Hypoxylon sp. CI-4A]